VGFGIGRVWAANAGSAVIGPFPKGRPTAVAVGRRLS